MKLVVITFASLLIAGAALAQRPKGSQQSKRPAPRKATPKPTEIFSTVPFDSSVEQLPPNYQGHSMIAIWAELNKRRLQLKKDEYETKEEWTARRQQLQDKPLIGSLTVSSQFAFRAYDIKDVYDADAKTLSVSVKMGSVDWDWIRSDTVQDHASILWERDILDAGSFIGSNAFGVTRNVRVKKKDAFFTIFKRELIGSAGTLKIEEVSVEQAKLIRPQIRVLIIGKLRPPYVGLDTNQNKATLDNPVETSSSEYYLYFRPEAVWFYNMQSGEVYYRAALVSATTPH